MKWPLVSRRHFENVLDKLTAATAALAMSRTRAAMLQARLDQLNSAVDDELALLTFELQRTTAKNLPEVAWLKRHVRRLESELVEREKDLAEARGQSENFRPSVEPIKLDMTEDEFHDILGLDEKERT